MRQKNVVSIGLLVVLLYFGFQFFFLETKQLPARVNISNFNPSSTKILSDFITKRNADNSTKILVFLGANPERTKLYPLIEELQKPTKSKILNNFVINIGEDEILQSEDAVYNVRIDLDMISQPTLGGTFEDVLKESYAIIDYTKPQLVMVQGNASSTFAVALAALSLKVPIAHAKTDTRYKTDIDSIAALQFSPTKYPAEKIVSIIKEFLGHQNKTNDSCSNSKTTAIANVTLNQRALSTLKPLNERLEIQFAESAPQQDYSLPELLKLPSKYEKKPPGEVADVTAVVSFYRRTNNVEAWVKGILEQTARPKEVWITHFASPKEEELKAEINRVLSIYKNTTSTVFYVLSGEKQLKYFGRFQLGMQIRTKYAFFSDDDCVPGSQFLELSLHAINTEQFHGILGVKGHPGEKPRPKDWKFYSPHVGSAKGKEIDVVGGVWFLDSDWVKLMFRDKLYTWETSEDVSLCAHARKYANIKCYTMPVNISDPTTWGMSSLYKNYSLAGDTTSTVSGAYAARLDSTGALYNRGDRRMYSFKENSPYSEQALLVFADNPPSAETLCEALVKIDTLEKAYLAVSTNFAIPSICTTVINTTFNIQIGRDMDRKTRPIDVTVESMYHFNMILENTLPAGVLVDGTLGDAATLGAVLATQYKGIPILNLIEPTDTIPHYESNVRQINEVAIATLNKYDIPALKDVLKNFVSSKL